MNVNYIGKSKRQQEKKEKDAKKRKYADLKPNLKDINETLVSKINLFFSSISASNLFHDNRMRGSDIIVRKEMRK